MICNPYHNVFLKHCTFRTLKNMAHQQQKYKNTLFDQIMTAYAFIELTRCETCLDAFKADIFGEKKQADIPFKAIIQNEMLYY